MQDGTPKEVSIVIGNLSSIYQGKKVLNAPLRWMVLNSDVKSHTKNVFYVHCYCNTINRKRWAILGPTHLEQPHQEFAQVLDLDSFYLMEDND